MTVHPIEVALKSGAIRIARPLTVRQRIALTQELATERAVEAKRNAEIAGLPASAALDRMEKARRDALVASALILDCYSLSGAMRVICAASEFGDEICDSIEPKDMTELALRLLGFGDDIQQESGKQSGN